jgi:hypothetical protein
MTGGESLNDWVGVIRLPERNRASGPRGARFSNCAGWNTRRGLIGRDRKNRRARIKSD